LATCVGNLVYKCNEVYRSKNGEDLFKATNETGNIGSGLVS